MDSLKIFPSIKMKFGSKFVGAGGQVLGRHGIKLGSGADVPMLAPLLAPDGNTSDGSEILYFIASLPCTVLILVGSAGTTKTFGSRDRSQNAGLIIWFTPYCSSHYYFKVRYSAANGPKLDPRLERS